MNHGGGVSGASLSSNNQILTSTVIGGCAITYFAKPNTNAVDLSDDTSELGEHLLPEVSLV